MNKNIEVIVMAGTYLEHIYFIGHGLPQTDNWHCYEAQDGTTYHFRKRHMAAVIEKPLVEEKP